MQIDIRIDVSDISGVGILADGVAVAKLFPIKSRSLST
jgi:hypothetical protein